MKSEKQTVCVIIPAFNEGARIGATLAALQRVGEFDRILVIDDGSRDNTALDALKGGADVISLAQNQGKANAMERGFVESREDILLYLDADLGSSAAEAGVLTEPIRQGRAEVTVARFPMTPGRGGAGLVKGLAALGLWLLTGRRFSSVLSGQRGFLRSRLSQEFFDYRGFGIEFGMTVDLLNQGAHLMEVDVTMSHRTTGRDLKGFIHRGRQFGDILRVLVSKMLKGFPKKLSPEEP